MLPDRVADRLFWLALVSSDPSVDPQSLEDFSEMEPDKVEAFKGLGYPSLVAQISRQSVRNMDVDRINALTAFRKVDAGEKLALLEHLQMPIHVFTPDQINRLGLVPFAFNADSRNTNRKAYSYSVFVT